ncbi:MAG: M55 family metallopeptidase [Clostridia bacterium]|nr:M55 family metallopeptidase [Clostridia bacterium]
MRKHYLVAVDLEGIHGVVGEPYKKLTDSADYSDAVENATKEINAVVKGLFDGGAKLVAVWDNHGNGKNLDFSKIDNRVIRVENPPTEKYERLSFAKQISFDGVLYIGYHAKEGTLNGVLAHSYNSELIQYYKVNGLSVGELEIDSWAAAEYGFSPLFCSSDDICISQAKAIEPKMKTVITKYGTGRNSARFRNEDDIIREMYENALACVDLKISPKKLTFPAQLEVRYTKSENALKKFEKVIEYGQNVKFGEDLHILISTLYSFSDLESFL